MKNKASNRRVMSVQFFGVGIGMTLGNRAYYSTRIHWNYGQRMGRRFKWLATKQSNRGIAWFYYVCFRFFTRFNIHFQHKYETCQLHKKQICLISEKFRVLHVHLFRQYFNFSVIFWMWCAHGGCMLNVCIVNATAPIHK